MLLSARFSARVLIEQDSPTAAGDVMSDQERSSSSERDRVTAELTARELEILHWVSEGMTDADIAVLCGISVRTVQKHLQNAYAKLNVENRVAALRKLRDLQRG